MNLATFMGSLTTQPDPAFAGFETADDMVLAVDFEGTAASPDEYLVAQVGIREHSGALDSQTEDSQYIRTGLVSIKTGTTRNLTINGDRRYADEFQDALNAHVIKYGRGQTVIKKYVYFSLLTGYGEAGEASIIFADDKGGEAGSKTTFSVTMTSTEEPVEYTYAGTPVPPVEPTPTASISYTAESLIGLTANADYRVNGTSYTANSSGGLEIQPIWFGNTINIIKIGVNGTTDSAAQSVVIPARGAAPTGITTTPDSGSTDGEINGVTSDMEYKLSTASIWTPITGTDVTGLGAGTYNVRYKATSTAFASEEFDAVVA